jgi:hypothetical protein
VKIVPFCICFVTHLICASPAKIKAAKSQICIIGRANINTRGGTVSFSDADLSNDHHEQFKLGTMLCQCGRLESCSAWLEVHAVTVSLLCRVTCAVTGCNIDVGEHHCSRVITLPGFLQSARPPSSLSRTWRHPRMARSLAFCALDNFCNLCNGFKGWRSIRRIIESVDHRTDQSVPY